MCAADFHASDDVMIQNWTQACEHSIKTMVLRKGAFSRGYRF